MLAHAPECHASQKSASVGLGDPEETSRFRVGVDKIFSQDFHDELDSSSLGEG